MSTLCELYKLPAATRLVLRRDKLLGFSLRIRRASVFLTLMAACLVVLNGCASYGVASQLQPYHKLTRMADSQISQEASAILPTLQVGSSVRMSSKPYALCRTEIGYFITTVKDTRLDTQRAIYLGSEPAQAAQTLVKLRDQIAYQQLVAQAQLAQAMAAALAAAGSQVPAYSMPESSYPVTSYYPPVVTPPTYAAPPSTPDQGSWGVKRPTSANVVGNVAPRDESGGVFPVRGTNNQGTVTRIRPDYSGGATAMDNRGNVTWISPDYSGGATAMDNRGNVTWISPDHSGGATATDNRGNVTWISPDYSGGATATDNRGNVTWISPDYSGGATATDSRGNVTRISPDYSGGYTVKR